jgi:hypothetical protein
MSLNSAVKWDVGSEDEKPVLEVVICDRTAFSPFGAVGDAP